MEILKGLYTKSPSLKIILENNTHPPTLIPNLKGELAKYQTFYDSDNISGKILIELNKNKNYIHNGIKIELFGMIEYYKDPKLNAKFISLIKDIEPPGILNNEISEYVFEFSNVQKQFESYRGINVGVKYIVQATILSSYRNIENKYEIIIKSPPKAEDGGSPSLYNHPLKMDVGVEDWLHVVFETNKSSYILKDIIEGTVTFKNVSKRLGTVELQLVKKETLIGFGNDNKSDNQIVGKFEIMDDTPNISNI
jgi:vacuolar protein sorting-associated protein 26